MHAGQEHAEADEEEQDAVEGLLQAVTAEPFEESREELGPQHEDVERDAGRDLEHHRVRVEIGRATATCQKFQ